MTIMLTGSLDDFFSAEEKAREAADKRVLPFQAALTTGDKFVRYLRDYDIVVWSRVLAPDEEDREIYEQPHMAHYRQTESFSKSCPEGEIGDVHVSSVDLVVTHEQFEQGRKLDWPSDAVTLHKIFGSSIN